MEKAAGEQPGGAMEKDQGGWPCSGTVEVLAIGASTAVENTGVAWRSAIVEVRVYSSCIDFFWRMETTGYS
jgi:hypothetical protein